MSAGEGESTEMDAGTMTDRDVEDMQWLHTYPLKQRRCCPMDCPLLDWERRGRSARRLCQLEGFKHTMIGGPAVEMSFFFMAPKLFLSDQTHSNRYEHDFL